MLTDGDLLDSLDVLPGHAYTLDGITDDGHVLLRNPHGKQHPPPLPLEQFKARFWRIAASGLTHVDIGTPDPGYPSVEPTTVPSR